MAKKTTPFLFDDRGILHIKVKSHLLFSLLNNYSHDKKKLLEKLQHKFPRVTGISFRVG